MCRTQPATTLHTQQQRYHRLLVLLLMLYEGKGLLSKPVWLQPLACPCPSANMTCQVLSTSPQNQGSTLLKLLTLKHLAHPQLSTPPRPPTAGARAVIGAGPSACLSHDAGNASHHPHLSRVPAVEQPECEHTGDHQGSGNLSYRNAAGLSPGAEGG